MHNRSPLVSARRRNPKAAFKPLPGSDETLECGGPAPLWPVSPCHSTANQRVCLRSDFAPRRTIGNVGQSAARPAHSKLGSHLPGVAYLECGGPAPLWPVSPCHSTANQRVCLRSDFAPRRTIGNVGQSAARPAHSKLGSHLPGVACLECGGPAPRWPVSPCHSTANQRVCLRRDFAPRRTIGNVGQSAARPAHSKLGSHLPGVACLECGGPAPLWPVSPCHSTANQGICLRSDFAPRRTIGNVGQSAARPAHSKLGSHLPGVAYPCNDSVKRNGQHT